MKGIPDAGGASAAPMKKKARELRAKVQHFLRCIYPEADAEKLCDELLGIMHLDAQCKKARPGKNLWSQEDVVVITYGDSIVHEQEKPLKTLLRFLEDQLDGLISAVHILPFYPWSSDDGFSVINYTQVNDALGDWDDIEAISARFKLMADLVINHCSARSVWFEQFRQDMPPGRDYFIEVDPDTDLSAVVRPRTNALLAPVETADGVKHVWCTFSHDQVDLNFHNVEVLKEIVRIVERYLSHGISIFRLDAVAFVWKELGTSCLNLQQTHGIVRLLRALIEHHDPKAVIITETNIPNRENLAYFGNANEAHVVYNFALPPILLHGLLTGNSFYLNNWMMSMPPAQDGTAYLNFIASHDGIGLRPVEGILSEEEITQLADTMQDFGGRISWRNLSDDEVRPYEINISLFDALAGTVKGRDKWQLERFICAHTIMLGLEGIPAFYIHSLLATQNDYDRLAYTSNSRAINRHVWDDDGLRRTLDDPESHHAQVLARLKTLIGIRRQQIAFHPNATQYTLHLGESIFAFWRQSRKRQQSIFCLHNISDHAQTFPLSDINLVETDQWFDLLSERALEDLFQVIVLQPYESMWITNYQADSNHSMPTIF